MTTTDPTPTRRDRRAARAEYRRGRGRWLALFIASGVALTAAVAIAVVSRQDADRPAAAARPEDRLAASSSTTASTVPPTTTTTRPAQVQPARAMLPPFSGTLGPGSDAAIVRAYQQRLADLAFDPGPVDGTYGSATTYAVQALQKLLGSERTGRLTSANAFALGLFRHPEPLQADGEPNRTELDVTRQLLTVYVNHQVRLITTTSTGSGESYCYSSPRVNPTRYICEVANTPSGRFTYTRWVKGWDPSPLGRLYQPYYFNGGIAVHGYESVPTGPASHGCARIPMHIAEYYPLLVKVGDPVYVFGGTPAEILSSRPIGRRSLPAGPTTSAPPAAPVPSTSTPTPPPAPVTAS